MKRLLALSLALRTLAGCGAQATAASDTGVNTSAERNRVPTTRNDAAAALLPAKVRRTDGYLGPNPSIAYHVKTSGETETIGKFSGAGPTLQGLIAATTTKDDGLVEAYQAALNAVIADGSYAKVLDRWNVASEAVAKSEINPPGLPLTS